MSRADLEKWDPRHHERGFYPSEPASFVTESLTGVAGASALDVAGGSGRHALWLAEQGAEVTLLDISPVALELAREEGARRGLPSFRTVTLDLDHYPVPAGPWDIVLWHHYLHRDHWAGLPRVLAPGGRILLCHPTRRNLERHDRPPLRFLLEEGELARLVSAWSPELEILTLEEGWNAEGRHEARVIARRPADVRGRSGRLSTADAAPG